MKTSSHEDKPAEESKTASEYTVEVEIVNTTIKE